MLLYAIAVQKKRLMPKHLQAEIGGGGGGGGGLGV